MGPIIGRAPGATSTADRNGGLHRDVVADVMTEYVYDIQYDNYKNSVNEEAYHDTLIGVWNKMYAYGRPYRPNITTLKDWMNDSSN